MHFVLQGLRHYRRAYIGVLLGAALGAMVLLGSLFSGDSVRHTLATVAGQRTGEIRQVVTAGENFFRARLADDLGDAVAPLLQLQGQADTPDGRTTGQVDLLGVTPDFWEFAPEPMAPPELGSDGFAINRALARTLDVAVGDSLVIRLRKPSLLSTDAPLSGSGDALVALRGTVRRIVGDAEMGRFSLAATQLPSPKIFLPLERLAEAVEQPRRANLLLGGDGELTSARLEAAMTAADYGLETISIPPADEIEIRTNRVFFPEAMESRLRDAFPEAHPVLTYFVNTLAANERETPYSMAAGVEPERVDFVPDDLGPDEIVLNEWQAGDLAAEVGDTLSLTYYVLRGNNRLAEESHDFTVRAIVPLEGLAADRRWMPDFPGLAEAETSADWSPGMPLDLGRIRDRDETYWDDHRGTPKAFVHYDTARRLWGNRWGGTTALRLPGDTPDPGARTLDALDPAAAGFAIRDLAAEAERAAASPTDIATLFLSMSFFLIVAALALTTMLFRFNVERRNAESGLLSALGIAPRKILRWRLAEGLAVVALGSLLGALLALAYTQGLLRLLEGIWNRDPEGGERLFRFHAAPASIIGGLVGFIALTMAAIAWVTRRQSRRAPSLRLAAETEEIVPPRRPRSHRIAAAAALAGIAALFSAPFIGPQGAYFAAGFFLLIAGLAAFVARTRGRTAQPLNVKTLAALNIARRPTRSLVAVGSLAAGVFLVISVTAFQKHGGGDWSARDSGTGGFALWIETTLPVPRPADDDEAALPGDAVADTLPFRVGAGDDASCFNLNSVARPRLLATEVSRLRDRFTIKTTLDGYPADWSALKTGSDDDALPAFVDETTLLWALKRDLGDRIRYTDDSGETFPVRIVGTLADSVFQGHLIVDEAGFLERFPSASGHRLFLAETGLAPDRARAELQADLTDLGATITPTTERLAAFRSVENAYIGIFNLLGGLGVILGSAGLGLVLARNLHERRDELAMLATIGIGPPMIRRLIRREAAALIAWAAGIGLVAALVSIVHVLPATGPLPTLGAILVFTLLILAVSTAAAALAVHRAGPRLHGGPNQAPGA